MASKMNSTTHKVIDATYLPPVVQFAVPRHWDVKRIDVKQGKLYYKGELRSVPRKFDNFDIQVQYHEVTDINDNGWSVEEVFDESSDEEEIVFHCTNCKKAIIRDSQEHDLAKFDENDEEKWYCWQCPLPEACDEEE